MKISPLLDSLIHAKYDTTHSKDEYSMKAYLCVDCGGNSLTKNEMEKHYNGHKVFRTRKNSNCYSYTQTDILSLGRNVLDVSGVCVYSINSTSIYFLKSRLDKKKEEMIGRYGWCYSCGMSVKRNGVFCSILCKLECNKSLEEVYKSMRFMIKEENVGVYLKKKNKGSGSSTSKKRKRDVDEKGKNISEKNNRVFLKIMHGGKTVILGNNVKGKKLVEEEKLENLTDVVQGNLADVKKKIMSFRTKSRKGILRPFED